MHKILIIFQNSIRHNLSLHSRFVRVQNEGSGKSSWWMLNPEAAKQNSSSNNQVGRARGSNPGP